MIQNVFKTVGQAFRQLQLFQEGQGRKVAPLYATTTLTASTGTRPKRKVSPRRPKRITSAERKRNAMQALRKALVIPQKLQSWLNYENPRGRRTSRPGRAPFTPVTQGES